MNDFYWFFFRQQLKSFVSNRLCDMFNRRIELNQYFALIINQIQTKDLKRVDIQIIWHKSWIDMKTALEKTIKRMLQFYLLLMTCIDFKILYKCFVKLKIIYKKHLIIDVMNFRQSYERREITEIWWIDENNNSADFMTKIKTSSILKILINNNRINLNAI